MFGEFNHKDFRLFCSLLFSVYVANAARNVISYGVIMQIFFLNCLHNTAYINYYYYGDI